MLVLGVNSKRQRRPNVRLVEIGDCSAALSCGISQKLKGNWVQKGSKQDHVLQFGASDPGVSRRALVEAHNRENRDPNSGKAIWDFVSSDDTGAVNPQLNYEAIDSKFDSGAAEETNAKHEFPVANPQLNFEAISPKLDFGAVMWKGRLMKRRGRSTRSNGKIGNVWNFKSSPEISNGNDIYTLEGRKDSPYHEASDMSKDTPENACFGGDLEIQKRGDLDELWMENGFKENNGGLSSDNGNCSEHQTSTADRMLEGTDVNNVGMWLEELGFGKYTSIFKIHEVDEEVLPLLTFEDLKEMGINAVGPRRKIFTAIQLLRKRASA